MIKGGLFLKLLKQLFIISLISCFILLGNFFASAGEIRQIGIYDYSPYDSGYDVNVLTKGTFLTQQIGYTKNLLYLSSRSYWFWSYDSSVGFNNLYNYMNGYYGGINQGFVNSYAICPYSFTGVDSNFSLSSCSEYSITSDSYIIFRNFLSAVSSSDYYYVDFQESSWASSTINRLCFSSSELGKLLCFGNCRTSYPQGASCSALNNTTKYGNTHASKGFGSGFNSVSLSYLQGSPAITDNSPGNVEGSSNIGENAQLTGNVVYSVCNNMSAYEYYTSQGYTNNLCYAGVNDLYYSGLVVNVPGKGLTFRAVYNATSGDYNIVSDWLDYWRSAYGQRNVLAENPFSSQSPALFNYIENVEKYGNIYDSVSIYDYCRVYLESDLDGTYLGPLLSNFACNSEGDVVPIQSTDLSSSSSGQYISQSDWSGIGIIGESSSGLNATTFDGKTFINNVFNQIKSSVIIPNKGDFGLGYLPTYIIMFMIALIVFRFISH